MGFVLSGCHIALQEKLLSPENASLQLDNEFLKPFTDVVGKRWPFILSLMSSEIVKMKEGRDHTFHMLKTWASNEGTTYFQLLQRLKNISLFHYAKETAKN